MNDRADATEKQSGAQWKPPARKPELIKVTERIFCAVDYPISNGIVLAARPQNGPVRQLRIAALRELATRARNGVERNLYADAAAALAQVSRHVRKNRPLPAFAPATTFKT